MGINNRILILGTSEGTEKQNDTYKIFPYLLQDAIYADYGKKVRIINKAISNTTTTNHIANRYSWQLTDPDVIIYCGTGNDCVTTNPAGGGERVTSAQMLINLQNIYTVFKAMNPSLIIFTKPWYVNNSTNPYYRPNHQTYRDAFAGFLEGGNTQGDLITTADFETAWASDAYGANTYDDVHPNGTGSTKLHNIVYPLVQDWVSKLLI